MSNISIFSPISKYFKFEIFVGYVSIVAGNRYTRLLHIVILEKIYYQGIGVKYRFRCGFEKFSCLWVK